MARFDNNFANTQKSGLAATISSIFLVQKPKDIFFQKGKKVSKTPAAEFGPPLKPLIKRRGRSCKWYVEVNQSLNHRQLLHKQEGGASIDLNMQERNPPRLPKAAKKKKSGGCFDRFEH